MYDHVLSKFYSAALNVWLHMIFNVWDVGCKKSCHTSLFVEVL